MRNKDSELIDYTIPIKYYGKWPESKSNGKLSRGLLNTLKLIIGFCTTIAITTITPFTLIAQETIDTVGVKELVVSYQNAWNTKNPSDFVKFFSEDADMVFGNWNSAKGREAIENWWQNYFSRQESDRRGWFELTSIKFLNSATAVLDVISTTGIVDDTTTYRKARGTWLVQQIDGHCQINAMRGLPTIKDQVDLVASEENAEILRSQIRAFVAVYEEAFNQDITSKRRFLDRLPLAVI